jgi:hypothetical protein
MRPHKPRPNLFLLVALVLLYLLTLAAFNYANWAADPEYMEWWMPLVNSVLLSIPLLLLYVSIYVLVVAWRERAASGQINPRLAKVIHWAPRSAAILLILFISLFSLDVFGTDASPLQLLGGFLMHNIPSITMLLGLILAWKRPAVGFVAFLLAGVLFAFFFVRDVGSLPNLVIFVGPLLLIAGLFYADWKWLAPRSPGQIDAAA